MSSIDTLLKWFADREGRVYYSMTYRNGQIVSGRPNFDCSSSVYYALINAGFLPSGHRIGNTDTLFGDLEKAGWVRTDRPQRGSIFIWGVRGASGGASGHTGAFKDSVNIIHCASGYNGIHSDNHDWLWGINGRPAVTYYTYQGTPYEGDDDQNVEVGSTIRFDKTFTVNDVQLISGLWQVKSDELCPIDFTWDENGIPAEPLYEVDSDRFATQDQDLNPGSQFVIPGKFTVQDVGEHKGRWLALIQWSIYRFWVDLEHATEIKSSQVGKSVPKVRPIPTIPVTPEEPVKPPVVIEDPPVIVKPEPAIEQPKPPKPNQDVPQKEENKMAFTAEEQQKLAVASKSAEEFAALVAESEDVKEITGSISKKTKLTVYIIGDTLLGLGILTPSAAIVFGWTDVVRIVALSGLFTAAGGFLLTMFGIYKSGKK